MLWQVYQMAMAGPKFRLEKYHESRTQITWGGLHMVKPGQGASEGKDDARAASILVASGRTAGNSSRKGTRDKKRGRSFKTRHAPASCAVLLLS